MKTEWRMGEGDAFASLILHGRYMNLIVLGQWDEDDNQCTSEGVADIVVRESGRPVLVVPYIGAPDGVGDRVLVAWSGTRESVRAVFDAMALLREAKKVDVVVVNPDAKAHGEMPGADLCLHLARQGVNAEAHHVVAHDIDVGDLVLGGTTRHLLAHMTVPVLMAHCGSSARRFLRP